jgi:hypothetical protein
VLTAQTLYESSRSMINLVKVVRQAKEYDTALVTCRQGASACRWSRGTRMLCGCACEPQGGHHCPIRALRTTDIHMYLVCTRCPAGKHAVDHPSQHQIVPVWTPRTQEVGLQKPSSAGLANDDQSMDSPIQWMTWSFEQISLILGLFIWSILKSCPTALSKFLW